MKSPIYTLQFFVKSLPHNTDINSINILFIILFIST